MSPSKTKEPINIFKALSNPIRRNLVSFIGDKTRYGDSVSFTQIQQEFNMKVGTLYHHLDSLGDLITQDEKKKYLLTPKGVQAYNLIEDKIDAFAKEMPTFGPFSFLHRVFLRDYFEKIQSDPLRFLGISLFIFSGLVTGSYFLSYGPIFIFPTLISPQFLTPVLFVLSALVIYLLIELFTSLFFRKTTDKLALFQAVLYSQIPLFIFSIIEYFVMDVDYSVSPLDISIWLFLLLIFIQLLFLGIIIEALIVIKGLRMEKAGLIALLVIYLLNLFSFLLLRGLVVSI
ncbi:MAG: winged helix-turn-helix domain-containing protein [Candidatus Heimdallarchaeaceae archaeon]